MMTTICVLMMAVTGVASGDDHVLFNHDTTGGPWTGLPHAGHMPLNRHHAIQRGPVTGAPLVYPGAAGHGADSFAGGRRFANTKSQLFFVTPEGLNIGWQVSGDGAAPVYLENQLVAPAKYNFVQGYIYRLKITNIENRPGVALYPSLEVARSTPKTDAYLTHNPVPVVFLPEDFTQVIDGGNFLTKVIYLPDPEFQELAIAGVETLVSTRLEPGVDPIVEADRRGTILLIVRLGAIDLEMNRGLGIVGAPNALPMEAPINSPIGDVYQPGMIPSEPGFTPMPAPVNQPTTQPTFEPQTESFNEPTNDRPVPAPPVVPDPNRVGRGERARVQIDSTVTPSAGASVPMPRLPRVNPTSTPRNSSPVLPD